MLGCAAQAGRALSSNAVIDLPSQSIFCILLFPLCPVISFII